jgi:hypothetical protein
MISKILLTTGLFILALILLFSEYGNESNVRVYDCGMAEWHPDIPVQVKEECRRLKYESWKKNNENTI